MPRGGSRTLAWLLVLAVLVLVFRAYLDPHTVRDLSDRVWACFN